MAINPVVFITVLVVGSLLWGWVLDTTILTDEEKLNKLRHTLQEQDEEYKEMSDSIGDSSSITSDSDFVQTAGNEFDMSFNFGDAIHYAFSSWGLFFKEGATIPERIIIFPAMFMQTLIGIYTGFLIFLYFWNKKSEF